MASGEGKVRQVKSIEFDRFHVSLSLCHLECVFQSPFQYLLLLRTVSITSTTSEKRSSRFRLPNSSYTNQASAIPLRSKTEEHLNLQQSSMHDRRQGSHAGADEEKRGPAGTAGPPVRGCRLSAVPNSVERASSEELEQLNPAVR